MPKLAGWNYSGNALYARELGGVCCKMKNSNGWGVKFRRRCFDTSLKYWMNNDVFSRFSIDTNTLIERIRPIVNMRFVRRCGSSSLNLYRTMLLVLNPNDSKHSFLWAKNEENLHARDHPQTHLQGEPGDRIVSNMVPTLYTHIDFPPTLWGSDIKCIFAL